MSFDIFFYLFLVKTNPVDTFKRWNIQFIPFLSPFFVVTKNSVISSFNFFTVISPFWLKCLKSISLRKQERHTLSLPNIDKKTNKDECLFYLCYYVYYNQLPIYMLSCNLDKRKDVIHFYYTNYYKILQIKMSNYFYHEQLKN